MGFFRSFFRGVGISSGWIFGIGLGIFLVGMLFSRYPTRSIFKGEFLIGADEHGKMESLASSAPVLLRLDIQDVIGGKHLTGERISELLSMATWDPLVKGRVRGLLLYINSPGGSATDSDTIYQAVLRFKKQNNIPVHAFVNGMCASGGFYIACAADTISTTPSSAIGSVGVRAGPYFNFIGALNKYGAQALTLTEGKDKDELNPFRAWRSGEGETLQQVLHIFYERFVHIVTQARPRITPNELVNAYGAHIYAAEEAIEKGYADKMVEDYGEAVANFAHEMRLEEYQVLILHPSFSVFDRIQDSVGRILTPFVTTQPSYL